VTARPLLELSAVSKRFGGLKALDAVTFEVCQGDLLGLIGPNGAGKTTLFNVVTGVYRPDGGGIRFDGRDIGRLAGHQVCRLGIARTFQTVRPFLDMTVRDNVVVGAHFGNRGAAGPPAERDRLVDTMIDFVGLSPKAQVHPRSLTLVERKMVELARVLATRPRLVLLDEVLAGLNPTEMGRATGLIRRLRDEMGITVLWIEHVMRALMSTCERVVVLNYGRVLAQGGPAEVVANPEVVKAYLGEKGGGGGRG
jgi:branched-chain amino acid transport system ATP-binding protein